MFCIKQWACPNDDCDINWYSVCPEKAAKDTGSNANPTVPEDFKSLLFFCYICLLWIYIGTKIWVTDI